MILTTHALVGSAIGKSASNPWIIITASLVMHYILDSFRHGEYVESFDSKVAFKNTWWKVALDFFPGLVIIFFIIYYQNLDRMTTYNIFLGSFASMFPDLLTLIYWKFRFPLLGKIYAFHAWVHKHPRFSPERYWTLRNAANDILISLLAIFLLFLN